VYLRDDFDLLFVKGQYSALFAMDYLQVLVVGLPFFYILKALFCFFAVTASLGIKPRLSLTVAAVSFYFLVAPLAAFHNKHSYGLVCFSFLALALSDKTISVFDLAKGKWQKQDLVPSWNKNLQVLILASPYFQAAISKLYNGGWQWLNGSIVKQTLVYHYLYNDNEINLLLGRNQMACSFIAIAVLIFEFGFVSCVFLPALRRYYFVLGLLFHFANGFFLSIFFIKYFICSYLILIDWDALIFLMVRRPMSTDASPVQPL
jgi:hypothetical protein